MVVSHPMVEKRQIIQFELYSDDLIMQIAEGWINPKNWTLWNSKEETPLLAIQALERQKDPFEFGEDDDPGDTFFI